MTPTLRKAVESRRDYFRALSCDTESKFSPIYAHVVRELDAALASPDAPEPVTPPVTVVEGKPAPFNDWEINDTRFPAPHPASRRDETPKTCATCKWWKGLTRAGVKRFCESPASPIRNVAIGTLPTFGCNQWAEPQEPK